MRCSVEKGVLKSLTNLQENENTSVESLFNKVELLKKRELSKRDSKTGAFL